MALPHIIGKAVSAGPVPTRPPPPAPDPAALPRTKNARADNRRPTLFPRENGREAPTALFRAIDFVVKLHNLYFV